MFQKLLIANRGEIAVRIIRACREMGIKTVAVYSQADADALHTQLADESICIGKAEAKDSYLNMERILSATIASGADAIHPGFGFLSENSKFAALCEKCNIAFIGPSARTIEETGNKSEARNAMVRAGVPVIPGTKEPIFTAEAGRKFADEIGYPVMIKAALGGGGKGMRVVRNSEEFEKNFQNAQREAENGFGDNSMYIEKYIEHPKHIEFQILADNEGNTIHLGERDCSVQRRHQKMIEESPCTALDEDLREQMGAMAVRAAKAVGYRNAGTVEFLLDSHRQFYFMEINTRIQVEHGVTELVTGIDLVKEQIRIAAGEKLGLRQSDIHLTGHAMEVRINAENPDKNFAPCPGKIQSLLLPAGGLGLRVDAAVFQDYVIPPYYDSMIAKVIVHGKDRQEAIAKMRRALYEFVIDGIDTNIDFQGMILSHPDYISGEFDTSFIEEKILK